MKSCTKDDTILLQPAGKGVAVTYESSGITLFDIGKTFSEK